MNSLNPKTIVFSIIGIIVLLIVLIFTGVIPGLKKNNTGAPAVQGDMSVWVLYDTEEDYATAIASFRASYPNVKVNFRSFTNEATYKKALLEALATNQGPDIFMIDNASVIKDKNKIYPLSTNTLSLVQIQNLFPRIVEKDFVNDGYIFGLPLSINTLVMLYNKDIFDAEGIAEVPVTWEEFKLIIPRLVKTDSSDRLIRAGAAIGGSGSNINNASNLVELLMMQSGTQMTDDKNSEATFASSEGEEAVRFYSGFSNPRNDAYTWNSSMPNSLDAFANGSVAMIFDYKQTIQNIHAKNQWLNVGIAPIPYPAEATCQNEYDCRAAYARYYGYTVSRQSKLPLVAWNLIVSMTTQKNTAESYMTKTGNSPALRSLIGKVGNSPDFSAEARQALIARSWAQPDREAISKSFSDMIDAITLRGADIRVAIKQAEDNINKIFDEQIF